MYMRKQFHFYYGTRLTTCQGNTALFAQYILHQSHTAQQENPARQCDGGKQRCQHNDTCGKFSVISHIGRHDIAGNRRRRAQHNQGSNQLRILGKPSAMASGRKTAGKKTNLIAVAQSVGLIFASALVPSNPAPTTSSASRRRRCADAFNHLERNGWNLYAQQGKRQSKHNADNNRIFEHIDARFANRPCAMLSAVGGKCQNNDRVNIKQRHGGHQSSAAPSRHCRTYSPQMQCPELPHCFAQTPAQRHRPGFCL